MILVGPHVSIGAGIDNAPIIANKLCATTFALFTGNVKRWESKPISDDIANNFIKNCVDLGFDLSKIVPHAKYMINLCNPDDEKVTKSRITMIDELNRAKQLGLSMVNVHPGSTLGAYDDNQASYRIAESINYVLENTEDVKLVLETTAGQGNDYGYKFEQLVNIIDKVNDKTRIGVCIDTCHSFAAGYQLDNNEGIEQTISEFDIIIGLEYLKAVHLNDSKMPCGSKKDRHSSIGEGLIGANNLKHFANHNKLQNIPMILETPNSNLWFNEIDFIKA